MKFNTKFNINESAWLMKDNVPIEVEISAIHIFECSSSQSHIKYSARDVKNSVSWIDHQNLFERQLFKSKEDLLNSLFGKEAQCKGENCTAIKGKDHSKECLFEHFLAYSGLALKTDITINDLRKAYFDGFDAAPDIA